MIKEEAIRRVVPPETDPEEFIAAMHAEPSVSIKLNRRKCTDAASTEYSGLSQVPWCPYGYYLESRPKFTLNPLLHAGVFYVQDASSMIYETITSALVERFRLKAPIVLDLCAAPGGKTTSMINGLPDDSLIVANEVVPKRASILYENITKWGFPNAVVTNSGTSDIGALGELFDIIAVDAPCSGEGMMRKDEDAVAQWSEGLVEKCASLQRQILADAVEALAPGGFLIYSTCTFNRSENEENLAWLIESCNLEPVDMNFPGEWGIGHEINSPYPALRFMPHLTRGEGLFVAVVRKRGERDENTGTPSRQNILEKIKRRLRVIGAPETRDRASMKRPRNDKEERPAAGLALSTAFDRKTYPAAELEKEDALRYLRHEALFLPPDIPKGFVAVYYHGHPLGFVKNLGSRANNLYPAAWRIRNFNFK